VNVTGEWILVCLAYNIKRLHTLLGGVAPALAQAAQFAAPVATLGLVLLVTLAASLDRLFCRIAPPSRVSVPHPVLIASCLGCVAFSPTGC